MALSIGQVNLGIQGAENIGSAAMTLMGGNEQYASQEENYANAAQMAEQNANLTAYSTQVQQYQAQRKTNQVIGMQQAAVGASGFQESGSALDLLRSSTQQGALTQSMIGLQGQMNEDQYKEEEETYQNEAKAASVAGRMNMIGAAITGVAGVAEVGAAVMI